MSKIITDEQIQKIKDVYESNHEVLLAVEENDDYYDMYSDNDINDIFEKGYTFLVLASYKEAKKQKRGG